MKEIKEIKKILSKESNMYESLLVGYFWNNPDLYSQYDEAQINSSMFLNSIWKFYFSLGKKMHEQGYKTFDDVTVAQFVQESNKKILELYEEYGEFETVEYIMEEVDGKEENFDIQLDKVRKYALMYDLSKLFGEKVLKDKSNDKYNYKEMNAEQIATYWQDKVLSVAISNGDNKYEEHDFLSGLREEAKQWDENPSIGLPFYKSRHMTNICTGWDFGHLYMLGGFGGSGKTSFMFNKVIMSCIENNEKLLVIANEQSVSEFRQMLIITAMGSVTKETINRQRLNEGNFTEEEWEKINKAIEWVEETCEDKQLIKFVFMKDYIMEDVKKIIRRYANRGYRRIIVDTGKPSEGTNDPRWERFTEDMKELYKLARKNSGLNLAIWVNIQLADTALRQRFLNEFAMGESKKAKNEASVLFMMRPMWDDEYAGGKNALTLYKYVDKDKEPFSDYELREELYTNVEEEVDFNSDKPYTKYKFEISKGKTHYLLFTAKNRRGQANNTGLDILVFRPNFNTNSWVECGWTTVHDDKSY